MLKRCKVVMLPTKEKSDIFIGKTHSVLHYKNNIPDEEFKSYQHLYIISDDEIKKGDYIYCTITNIIEIDKYNHDDLIRDWKKVIATTDSSLWRPSHKYASDVILLPQPSQQFIEKFIEEYNRGNVITDVLIEYELISNEEYFGNTVNPDYDVPYFDEKLKINPKDNTITIKKGNIPWNYGTAKPKVLKGNRGKTENSIKNHFQKGFIPWNKNHSGYTTSKAKKVYQYCPYTGEFIKEWNSVKEVFLELNINAASIAHCCRLKSKSAGGYIWKYFKQEKIEIMNNVKLKIKKIC